MINYRPSLVVVLLDEDGGGWTGIGAPSNSPREVEIGRFRMGGVGFATPTLSIGVAVADRTCDVCKRAGTELYRRTISVKVI